MDRNIVLMDTLVSIFLKMLFGVEKLCPSLKDCPVNAFFFFFGGGGGGERLPRTS